MAFVWEQNISVGTSIDSADITEIRNNVDAVDDSKCATHNVSVNAGYDSTVDSDHDGTYCNDENGTYNNNDNTSEDTNYNSSVDTDDHGTHRNDANAAEDTNHNTSVDSADYPSNYVGNAGFIYMQFYGPFYSTYRAGEGVPCTSVYSGFGA